MLPAIRRSARGEQGIPAACVGIAAYKAVKTHKLIIHTDIILDHLCQQPRRQSVLRLAMAKYFCYTTVFNAIELFSLARSASERKAVTDALSAMKVLGLNARSAPRYGEWIGDGMNLTAMNTLIAGVCRETRIPLLTRQPKLFRAVKQVSILDPAVLEIKPLPIGSKRRRYRRSRK